MSLLRKSLVSAALLCATSNLALAAEPSVVASIKPVHSLVSAIMAGVGTPGLLLEGAASPHTASLKPSQAAMIEKADIIFWIGEDLEPFLEKPVETVGARAHAVALMDAPGMIHLVPRSGGSFERHGHDDHDDHAHGKKDEDHSHGHSHAHDHAKASGNAHGHDDHEHGEVDSHVWLDPENAKAMARAIAAELAEHDPANAATYSANLASLTARLDAETAEIATLLAPVGDKGFVVFHDAYQYFEKRFGLAAAGSITVSPEVIPGAERVAEIKGKIAELGATCVFIEPQFEPKLVTVVTEGTQARTGTLDPLGATLADGPDLYPTLLRNLATSLRDCLAGEG